MNEINTLSGQIGRLDGVQSCAVLARQNAAGTVMGLCAFVCPQTAPDAAAIKAALRESLPEYMIPRSIRFLERLPVTANGKTDRKALVTL